MNAASLINQTSGDVEIYTPAAILDRARCTMGAFDLDPASSAEANKRVDAARIFTAGGLAEKWSGRVWMNHPFGKRLSRPVLATDPSEDDREKFAEKWAVWSARCRANLLDPETASRAPGNEDWIAKLVQSYEDGPVDEACCICFASTSEKWFRPLLNYPQCFLSPRTNYLLPDGSVYRGVTKGSVVTYFGRRVGRFYLNFRTVGVVKVSYVRSCDKE